MNDNPKLKKNGGPGTRVGNFLRSLKGKVLPTVLEAVGVGDLAKAVGIISTDENNAGLSESEKDYLFELLKLDYQDLADARDMQKEALKQEDIFSKRFVYYLAIVVVAFVFVLVGGLFFVEIPQDNKTIIDMVIGIIIGGFTSIMAFFFGSSKGSKDKQAEIEKLTNRI